jgi:hypothetical protein
MAQNDLLALVREKQAQIAKLQAELDEVRQLLLNGHHAQPPGPSTRSSRRKKPNAVGTGTPSSPEIIVVRHYGKRRRRQSSVTWAAEVVHENGGALHVDEMIRRIATKFHQNVDKQTLVSNLARLAKRREMFERTAPNTFGLIGGK